MHLPSHGRHALPFIAPAPPRLPLPQVVRFRLAERRSSGIAPWRDSRRDCSIFICVSWSSRACTQSMARIKRKPRCTLLRYAQSIQVNVRRAQPEPQQPPRRGARGSLCRSRSHAEYPIGGRCTSQWLPSSRTKSGCDAALPRLTRARADLKHWHVRKLQAPFVLASDADADERRERERQTPGPIQCVVSPPPHEPAIHCTQVSVAGRKVETERGPGTDGDRRQRPRQLNYAREATDGLEGSGVLGCESPSRDRPSSPLYSTTRRSPCPVYARRRISFSFFAVAARPTCGAPCSPKGKILGQRRKGRYKQHSRRPRLGLRATKGKTLRRRRKGRYSISDVQGRRDFWCGVTILCDLARLL
ncbi:hypothetical protein B0H10DRAFT_1298031 [Mycena sp. CBHHK59/15]|nr:hypothetical protein B0H10DRAFT_1298031 [Mycena sp. CBHHK59/15]